MSNKVIKQIKYLNNVVAFRFNDKCIQDIRDFKKSLNTACQLINAQNNSDLKLIKISKINYYRIVGSFSRFNQHKFTKDIDLYIQIKDPGNLASKNLLSLFNQYETALQQNISLAGSEELEWSSTKSSYDFAKNDFTFSLIPIFERNGKYHRLYRIGNQNCEIRPATDEYDNDLFKTILNKFPAQKIRKKIRYMMKIVKILYKNNIRNVPSIILENHFLNFALSHIAGDIFDLLIAYLQTISFQELETFITNNYADWNLCAKAGYNDSLKDIANKTKTTLNRLNSANDKLAELYNILDKVKE